MADPVAWIRLYIIADRLNDIRKIMLGTYKRKPNEKDKQVEEMVVHNT